MRGKRLTNQESIIMHEYEEAKKEVDENIAEFHRQASLSDYDWSVEQIDKTLDM